MANKMPGIVIQGDEELLDLISQLPNRTISECSNAMRKVAKPIIADARSRLKKGHGLLTGALKKSLGVRSLKAIRKEAKVVMYIGPRRGHAVRSLVVRRDETGRAAGVAPGNRKHDPFNIAHFVEFGHRIAVGGKLERRSSGGTVRGGEGTAKGEVAPRPFLRPAVDANRGNFLSIMKEALKKAVETRAKQGKKKLFIPAWQGHRKGGDL